MGSAEIIAAGKSIRRQSPPAFGRRALESGLVALVVAALLPVPLAENYFLFFLVDVLIYSILALSLQLMLGYGGIVSLGHASFFGIGAYTSAYLMKAVGMPFPIAFLGAIAIALLGGLLMSPIIRLRDVYFAMASFAFGIIVSVLFTQWSTITGGHDGLPGIPPARIGPLDLEDTVPFYYLALVVLTVQVFLYRRYLASPYGQALDAIRQNETAARASGIGLTAMKAQVILLGVGSAGAAGSLFAHFHGSVAPSSFGWLQSVMLLAMLVVGGVRSFSGAILGTLVLLFLASYLRELREYQALVNGLILALFMIFLPRGLVGLVRSLFERVVTRARAKPEPGVPELTTISGEAERDGIA